MSHDIRTPLNAITGMTELAVAHFDDPQRVMDCLKKISTSSRHLLSLVNDILDVNGLEQSKIKLVRMVVSLPELLERLSSMMMPQAKTAGGQVFYYKTSEKGKYLAELLQKRFDYVLGEANKRLAKANDNYYLLLHVKAPIVIVECGFLSNSKEAARLEEEDYQDRMAWTIHMGILQYLNTVGNQTAKQ